MLILVQCHERQWRVVHPLRAESVVFRDGSMAFDFAEALAREHHAETGEACGVRVEAGESFVDAVWHGRSDPESGMREARDTAESHVLQLPIQPALG